ncbi:MAG TPA: DPP IV N-terminal domain-containing protein [Pyrinomonadaceae bacterium]
MTKLLVSTSGSGGLISRQFGIFWLGAILGGVLVQLVMGAVPRASLERKPVFREYRVAVDRAGGGDATLSPDGQRMVTSSKRSGNWEVWIYDLRTTQWIQVTNDPADDFEAKWSPDSSSLVFCSTRTGQKDIWTIDLKSGALKQITFSEQDDEYPGWSPDGKQLVYTGGPWGKRDYFVISATGGTPRKVSRQSGRAGACAFEPGGETLICHRYDLGSGDVIRLRVDNGEMTTLTSGTPWDYKPNISPNGELIAFSRAEEGPSQIYLLPGAGGKAQQLTSTPGDDRWPTWNASGDKLLFHRIIERGTAIKVLDRKTGVVRTLVDDSERPLQASFDPRAERVVYCSQTDDRKILKILHIKTGVRRVLPTGPGQACYPRWSPDGKRIAYVGKPDRRWEVSVISPDGADRQMLTAGNAELHGMDGPIDWSPDSTKLLFQSDTDPFEARIYVVDVNTRKVESVTDGNWFDEAPSWTPDGKSVIFMSTRGGNWTWGFFRRALNGGDYETLAGPDWNQKNYPRQGRSGALIWSINDEQDRELLSERSPSGKVRVLEEAGVGARWPSYSSDESQVVYTVMDRQVEYWIAENVISRVLPSVDTVAAIPADEAETQVCHVDFALEKRWRSPVDLHRR